MPSQVGILHDAAPDLDRGIRTSRQTYVRKPDGPWLMFDNQADPYQTNNLMEDPASGGLRRELDAQLLAALKRIGDEFRPRQYYLDKWGYDVGPHGSISYAPGAKVVSPRPQSNTNP